MTSHELAIYDHATAEIPDGSFELGGYHWIQTCKAMPEQYDVHSAPDHATERQVAYFRFRWGGLTVKSPDIDGELVYADVLDSAGWRGYLDPTERAHHAKRIVAALDAHLAKATQ